MQLEHKHLCALFLLRAAEKLCSLGVDASDAGGRFMI